MFVILIDNECYFTNSAIIIYLIFRCIVAKKQKAVSAFFKSHQILPFAFTEQSRPAQQKN